MRCSWCDFPLSPTRTTCPRCGAITGEIQDRQLDGQLEQPLTFRAAPYDGKQRQLTPPFAQQLTQGLDKGTYAQTTPTSDNTPMFISPSLPDTVQPLLSEQEATPQQPKAGSQAIGVGFGLAGLCLFMASLILVFVYFMAQSLSLPSNGLSSQLAPGQTGLSTAPKAQPSPTSPSPIVSPTATYPGQQYINNAQMASAVNTTNGQPTQPATSFRVGQTMYITFEVHPDNHVGAVCLLWYLNGRLYSSYPFALRTTVTAPAYSYAAASSAGSGYVEIYLETAPSCFDPNKILGARVDFTVTL